MPSAVTQEQYRSVPLDPPRKHWSRAGCEALEDAGLLRGERVELVEGELIDKMGKKRPHVNSVDPGGRLVDQSVRPAVRQSGVSHRYCT